MSSAVEIVAVDKSLGGAKILDRLNVRVAPSQFLSLLGPSGCGKTTTLRIIAGLLYPDAGRVLIDGEDVTRLPPPARNLGLVFQSYALWPHLTVSENVAFGLKVRRVPAPEIGARVEEALEMVRLTGLAQRYPGQLSGGQQQRVALARAIVIRPRVLLLDEPLSNLDRKLRGEMQIEIKRLQERLGITTVYVTHDQEEALAMSDRVVVMNRGVIEQEGVPREIYESPRSPFVAAFIGSANFLKADVLRAVDGATIECRAEDGSLVQVPTLGTAPGAGTVTLMIRPERVRLTPLADGVASAAREGTIEYATYVGARIHYGVVLPNGVRLAAEAAAEHGMFARGARVAVEYAPLALRVNP